MFGVDDHCQKQLTVDFDIPFRGKTFRSIYICPNGLMCFNQRYESYTIPRNKEYSSDLKNIYCLAPYFSDLTLTNDGASNKEKVFFKTYDLLAVDTEEASNVSSIVTELVTFNYKTEFTPAYVVKATWAQVPAFAGRTGEHVTFQVIFTTDGQKSYTFYNYEQGGMLLRGSQQFIGLLVDGLAEGQDDSPDGTFLQRPDQNIELAAASCSGAVSYQLTEDEAAQDDNYRVICKAWHKDQSKRRSEYMRALLMMPLCPCSMNFVWWDGQFSTGFATFDGQDSIMSVPLVPSMRYFPYGKTCSYNWLTGGFVRSGRHAGSFSSYNAILDQRAHALEDSYYKHICCDKANSCNKYFNVRPIVNRCYFGFPFRTAALFGDPHISTLDGQTYTFNGHGEYILTKLTNGQQFQIQCRTERALTQTGNASEATIFSAFAIQANGSWLQIELNPEKDGVLVFAGVNRASYSEYTLDYIEQGNDFNLVSIVGLDLSREGNTSIATFTETGITFNVTQEVGLLQMAIGMPTQYRGQTEGLLGNFNDDSGDDFQPRHNATSLPFNATERDIFQKFGQTWMTTTAESVFYYEVGLGHSDYAFTTFVPTFLDEVDRAVVNNASQVCGNNTQCVFDFVVTGNAKLARQTTTTELRAEETQVEAANLVPTLNATDGVTVDSDANYILQVALNQTTSFTVQASDDEIQTLQYEFVDNSANAQLSGAASDLTRTVSLQLNDTSPVNVSLQVKDSHGVNSPELVVVILLCTGCSGNGQCLYDVIREGTFDTFKYATCNCSAGWEGDECDVDIDACATNPCSVGRVCKDNAPGVTPTYNCSACPTGFVDNNITGKCQDIDECNVSSPCGNSARCVNTEGSYTCVCDAGYRARTTTNTFTCIDINECDESTSGCQQTCFNTEGSFNCSCMSGFTLNSDNVTCKQDAVPDVCNVTDCSAADGCVDVNGTGTCYCSAGFTLLNNNTCQDINECNEGICSQGCTNNNGSFTCSCYAGYQLGTDKITCEPCTFPYFGDGCNQRCLCGPGSERCDPVKGCVCRAGWEGSRCNNDVNECTQSPNVCGDSNSQCVNNQGSYTCPCKTGYIINAENTCVDVDECGSVELNTCQQRCDNTVGGFVCSCRDGFKINETNPLKCEDINECQEQTADCDHTCHNREGRYFCECFFGFKLNPDRTTCKNITDFCEITREQGLHCSDICRKDVENEIGYCDCNSGFKLGTDNQTCIDIKECQDAALNKCTFPDTCVDYDGGYSCSCPTGHLLENDRRTCTPCDDYHYGVNCSQSCNCGTGAIRCDKVSGCICNSGWSGDTCNVDKDECASASSNTCSGTNELCVNTPGNYECQCQAGYKRSEANCIDMDECAAENTNECSQLCVNTPGSYTCDCNSGFTKNGTQCNDIDECSGQNSCDQICTNSIGSYLCSCNAGFKQDVADRKKCTPQTVCTNTTYCSGPSECAYVNGVDVCNCRAGYEFQPGTNNTCIDIKECDASPAPCSQHCEEQDGGYQCACNQEGFRLDTDQATCIQCSEWTFGANCTQNCSCDRSNTETCSPTVGLCTCRPGWSGSNCSADIDECSNANLNNCPANSTCNNSMGSYACICQDGFSKTVHGQCQECDKTHFGRNCEQTCSCITANTATCDKVDGTCTCNSGWEGDTCANDTDECSNNASICSDSLKVCDNTPGAYRCICIAGYTLHANGSCIDNNECLEGTSNCTYGCQNIPERFECVCNPGQQGNGTTCTACIPGSWGDQCSNNCSCVPDNTVGECNIVNGACTCMSGWEGDTCSDDVNECLTNYGGCPINSTCNNYNGSYACICDRGFYKDTNDYCAECSGNRFGTNCTETCDCLNTNTANPSQSCNHVNGTCECLAGWNGTRCEIDIDECASNPCTGQNQGCHNTDGNYTCSCLLGYTEDVNGTCIETSTIVPTATTVVGQTSIDMYIELNLAIGNDDLTVSDTYDHYLAETTSQLLSFYQSYMQSNAEQVLVTKLRSGSLKVNFTLVMNLSDESHKKLARAIAALAGGDNVTMFGQPYQALAITVGNTQVNVSFPDANATMCEVYADTKGPCYANSNCNIINDLPACVCVSGWEWNMTQCADIDECGTGGSANCTANSTCINLPGSFTCECIKGYINDSGLCTECSGDKHGDNCSQPCDCMNNNTVSPSQSCNHVDGTCECLAGWNGTRCEIDIDECASSPCTGQNQGCHNTDGNYTCSCLLGYTEDASGICVETSTTTPAVTTQATQEALEMTIKFSYNFTPNVDLNVTDTYSALRTAVKNALENFYNARLQQHIRIVVISLRRASLVVDFSIVKPLSATSTAEVGNATAALAAGERILLDGQNVTAMTMAIGGVSVSLDSADVKCGFLQATADRCDVEEECAIGNDGAAVCRTKTGDDNFALIVGLAVGIPLSILLVVILVVLICMCAKRNGKHTLTNDDDRSSHAHDFWPRTVPLKMNASTLWRGRDPVFNPPTLDRSSSSGMSDDNIYRHPYDRPPSFPGGAQYTGPTADGRTFVPHEQEGLDDFGFDQPGASNFSWDWMFQQFPRNAKLEIPRPQADSKPQSLFLENE